MTNPDEAAMGHGAENGHCCGLTKREWFAGMAMEAAYWYHDNNQAVSEKDAENMAKSCVAYADALITELSKAKP